MNEYERSDIRVPNACWKAETWWDENMQLNKELCQRVRQHCKNIQTAFASTPKKANISEAQKFARLDKALGNLGDKNQHQRVTYLALRAALYSKLVGDALNTGTCHKSNYLLEHCITSMKQFVVVSQGLITLDRLEYISQ